MCLSVGNPRLHPNRSFSFAAIATRIPMAATATLSSAMFVSGTRNFDTRRNWYEKLALKNRYHSLVPVFGTGFWYVCHGPKTGVM